MTGPHALHSGVSVLYLGAADGPDEQMNMWASVTVARCLSECCRETVVQQQQVYFMLCLCYLLVLGFVYISHFFFLILENIDADGQGFCQGGFSIDFTKVSSHVR